MRVIAYALILAATGFLIGTQIPDSEPPSPCVISWDENQGAAEPSTFCILTREAAAREHRSPAR